MLKTWGRYYPAKHGKLAQQYVGGYETDGWTMMVSKISARG